MKIFLLGISGPSGAGKSSVTKLVEAENLSVLRISLDNYFNDVKNFPKVDGQPNWDIPGNLNFELLQENLRDLKDGKNTEIPLYNKATYERTYKIVKPKKIILVEGFLLFLDERVRNLIDRKIYIEVSDQIQQERRSKRETPERYRYIREVVIPNYKIYGLPTKKYADVVLNGGKTIEELKEEIKIEISLT